MLVGTTGCGLRIDSGPVPSPTPAAPTTDELARERVAAQADQLINLAVAVRRLRPDLAGALAEVVTDHAAHGRALRPVAAPGTTTPVPLPTEFTPRILSPSVLTPATALPALLAAERAAAGTALADLAAVSPMTARLLASVAAARQVHITLLSAAAAKHPPRAAPKKRPR